MINWDKFEEEINNIYFDSITTYKQKTYFIERKKIYEIFTKNLGLNLVDVKLLYETEVKYLAYFHNINDVENYCIIQNDIFMDDAIEISFIAPLLKSIHTIYRDNCNTIKDIIKLIYSRNKYINNLIKNNTKFKSVNKDKFSEYISHLPKQKHGGNHNAKY